MGSSGAMSRARPRRRAPRLQPLMIAYGFDAVEAGGRLTFRALPREAGGTLTDADTALSEDGAGGITQSARRRPKRSGGSGSATPTAKRAMTTAWRGDPARRRGGCGHGPRPAAGADPVRGAGHRRTAAGGGPGGARQPQFSLPPRCGLSAGEIDRVARRIDMAHRPCPRPGRARHAGRPGRAEHGRAERRPGRERHRDALPAAAPRFSHLHGPAASDRRGGAARTASGHRGDALAGLRRRLQGAGARRVCPEPAGRACCGCRDAADAAPRAPVGLWDRGAPMRVRIASGLLSSAETEAVLNGANVAAIGPGDGAGWEVLQFGKAELVQKRNGTSRSGCVDRPEVTRTCPRSGRKGASSSCWMRRCSGGSPGLRPGVGAALARGPCAPRVR
jgi:hypothetical protein